MYELGLSCKAIGTYRNAISAIVEITGVHQLGEDWLVSRLMKGIFHLRSPQPKYNSSLVDNLSWTANSYSAHAQRYPHRPAP